MTPEEMREYAKTVTGGVGLSIDVARLWHHLADLAEEVATLRKQVESNGARCGFSQNDCQCRLKHGHQGAHQYFIPGDST